MSSYRVLSAEVGFNLIEHDTLIEAQFIEKKERAG